MGIKIFSGGRSSTGGSPPPKKRRDIKPAVSGWTSTDDYYVDQVGIATRVYLDGGKRPFYFDTHDQEWRQRPQSQEEEDVSGVFLPGSTTQVTLPNGKKLWEFKKLDFHGKPVEHYFFYNGDEDERFQVAFSDEKNLWVRTDGQPIPEKAVAGAESRTRVSITETLNGALAFFLLIFWGGAINIGLKAAFPEMIASWGAFPNWLPGVFSSVALIGKVSTCQAAYLTIYLNWTILILGFLDLVAFRMSKRLPGFLGKAMLGVSAMLSVATIGLLLNRLYWVTLKIDFLIPFFQLLGWEC